MGSKFTKMALVRATLSDLEKKLFLESWGDFLLFEYPDLYVTMRADTLIEISL